MGDDAFVVCRSWWGGIGRDKDFSVLGWLGGLSDVFRISAERHNGR